MILELNFSRREVERLWHTGHHSFVSEQIERFETDDTDYSKNRSGLSDPTLRGIMEFDKLHPRRSYSIPPACSTVKRGATWYG